MRLLDDCPKPVTTIRERSSAIQTRSCVATIAAPARMKAIGR
jgi:hypothetical protein